MSSTKLTVEKRDVLGSKVKTLRSDGFIPANIYGKGIDSVAITVSDVAFRSSYDEAGDTGIIEISLDKEARPVLVDNVQLHPVTEEIMHIDFKQVNLKEKVVATVPFNFVGESPVEKRGLIVVHQMQEVDVEALPLDLPEAFDIDLSTLVNAESIITIADIKTNDQIEIQAEPDQIIVNVTEPKEEEMEIVEPTEDESEEQAEQSNNDTSEETPSEETAE